MRFGTPIEDFVPLGKVGLVYVHRDWRSPLSGLWGEREVRTFSSCVEIVADNARHSSLLIVGPDQILDPFQSLTIRQRFDLAVGLMPGDNPEQVLSRYFETSAQRRPGAPDILIDRTLRGDIVRTQQRWIFPDGSLDQAGESIALVTREARLVAITSHGRNDVVYLPHSILCGRNEAPDESPRDHRRAACGHGEETCFFRGRERVRLADFRSRILFLNSCMSISGKNGIFSPGFSLDAATLANPSISHFIGSPTIHHGEFSQALLFSLLLGQGLSVGLALELTEDTVVRRILDVPSFLIYGDPESRFPPSKPESVAVVDSDLQEYRNQQTHHLILIPRSGNGNPMLAIERAPAPTYLLPTRLGHFLFSNNDLQPGVYTWRPIDLEQFCDQVRTRFIKPLRRLKNIAILGIHPHRLSGRISDFENRLTQIRKGVRDLAVNQSSVVRLERIFAQTSRKKKEIDRAVLASLLERSHEQAFHISEVYRSECRVKEPSNPQGFGVCEFCGGPAREFRWEHRLEPDFGRRTTQCHRCGFLADVPDRSRLAARLRPAGEVFFLGGKIVADLEFGEQPPPDSLVACTILDIKRFGVPPAVDQGSPKSMKHRFVLEAPKALPPHHFWLRAYLVRSCQVYAWGANIWLSPPSQGASDNGI